MENFTLVLLVLFSGLCLAASFQALNLLFPARILKIKSVREELPGRSALIGLINTLFVLAIIMGFSALAERTGLEVLVIIPIVLLIIFIIIFMFGLTAMVYSIGEKFTPEKNQQTKMIYGAIITILACLTPFIGWFVLLPYLGLSGFGAAIIRYFQERKHNTTEIE